MTIKELAEEFHAKGYYGTTASFQAFMVHLLMKLQELELTILHGRDGAALVEGYDATFWHGSYTLLRDAICEHLADYIHDDDVAEECILIEAIERAGRRLAEQSTDAPASTNALDPVPQTGQEGSTRA